MGARKGTNNGGGRKPGTLNKATIERAAIAERILAESRMPGRKLGKEVLSDFTELFAGLAARYQPASTSTEAIDAWAGTKREAMFEKYATLACATAKELAKYQSPQLRAVMVAPAPEKPQGETRTRFTFTVFESGAVPSPLRVIDADQVPARATA